MTGRARGSLEAGPALLLAGSLGADWWSWAHIRWAFWYYVSIKVNETQYLTYRTCRHVITKRSVPMPKLLLSSKFLFINPLVPLHTCFKIPPPVLSK